MTMPEIVRSTRDVLPAHYTSRIESFSLLSEAKVDKHAVGDFEASGFKWKFFLYPQGNQKGKSNGYISLYLELTETSTLPLDFEVYASFRFFVFNHFQDKYLTIQDVANGGIRRFHRLKKEWGIDQLLSLIDFKDPVNGYLVKDSCALGAEVFVIRHNGICRFCVPEIKDPCHFTYSWRIDNFSAIKEGKNYSKEFVRGNRKWKLSLFPRGNTAANYLAVYLELADLKSLPSESKVFAKFTLRLRNQTDGEHIEREAEHLFCLSEDDWGFDSFLSLDDLNDLSKGFKVNDTIIVEAQILSISVYED